MSASAGDAADCALSGAPPYNCEGCDLRGRNLAGKDLTNANLKSAMLAGTLFRGVLSLRGADLTGATFGAGTDFSGCDLSATTMNLRASPAAAQIPAGPGVHLAGATIPFSTLGLTWSFLDLTGATIVGLPDDLSGLDVTQCDLTGFDFSNRILKNAHFRSAVMRGCNFSKCVMDHVVFARQTSEPTDLTGVNFCLAKIPGQAVFDSATLSGADFTSATLDEASFLDARMDGTVFDNTDLTNCRFSSPPRWSDDPSHLTSFRGARLNFSTLQKQWSCLDLADAVLVGLDSSVDLTWLEARHAVLTGRDFSAHRLDNCDLTGAAIAAANFTNAGMASATLSGANGDKPVFDGATLTNAQFNSLQINGTYQAAMLHGGSFRNATLDGAQFIEADLGPALAADKTATPSNFDGAKMIKMIATGARFEAAKFTGGVLLNGANFIHATLTKADLTGAQLGALSELFRVADGSSEYEDLRNGLANLDVAAVVKIFAAHHIALPPLGTNIQNVVPARSWTVKASATYTVLSHVWQDGTKSLVVFTDATAASLSSAFMPGALLTNANLYGVDAVGLEIWPDGAEQQLTGAIMDGIDLSNAILGGDVPIDLSQASLTGAHLHQAFLVNAKFAGAVLTGAVLDQTQLQGADFTDAVMTDAQLTDAAVGVAVPGTENITGVFLVPDKDADPFGVPGKDADAMSAELAAAVAAQFDLVSETDSEDVYTQAVSDLDRCDLTRLREMFENNGTLLGTKASVAVVEQGLLWRIDDPDAARAPYTVWAIAQTMVIKVRPALPTVERVFKDQFAVELRPQVTISAGAGQAAGSWIVDNDSTNPQNLTTGYVKFVVTRPAGSALSVYGTQLHATRGFNQQEMTVVEMKLTVLRDGAGTTYLAPTTVCPNGIPYGQQGRISWEECLRAREAPPKPPTCVPSPIAPCRTPKSFV